MASARADERAPSGTCPAGALEPLAQRVAPSVVRVEGAIAEAYGFVFGSDRLVVVPLYVVEKGRGILVRGRTGDVRRPTVVLVDPDHGLALLQLASPLPGAHPLVPSTQPIERGTTVVAFGAAVYDGPADATTPGVITRVAGDRFHASARVSFHPSWGSPLVDCDGKVVGVATQMGDEAVRVGVLPALIERSGSAPEYSPGWSLEPGAGAMFSFGRRDAWVGGFVGAALVDEDRLELSARADVSTLVAPREIGEPTDTGLRVGADLRVGYRFMLTEGLFPLYFVPSVGAVGGWERRWRSEASQVVTSSDCSSSKPCPVEQEYSVSRLGDRTWIDPVLGVALRLGPLETGYSLDLDVQTPAASTHRLTLGFQF